jgi:hypothetical protein
MGIKVKDYNNENIIEMIEKGFEKSGILLPCGEFSIRLKIKKIKNYNKLIIDVDGSNFRINDNGRIELKNLLDYYKYPNVKEPRRKIIDSRVLDMEVQRNQKDLSREAIILKSMLLILEKDKNLEVVYQNDL